MMKKETPLILIFIFICIGLIALLIQLPIYVNDTALLQFEQKVLGKLNFSEEVVFVESISACCNSSGTGNHTDLYVAVLVKSAADCETLSETVKNSFAEEDTYCNIYLVEKNGSETLAMKIADISFSKKIEQPTGYYILEFNKRAPLSLFDLRGC